jgi:hypothetical protein
VLDHRQQRLPDDIASALEAARTAFAQGRAGDARSAFEQALQAARQLGYA